MQLVKTFLASLLVVSTVNAQTSPAPTTVVTTTRAATTTRAVTTSASPTPAKKAGDPGTTFYIYGYNVTTGVDIGQLGWGSTASTGEAGWFLGTYKNSEWWGPGVFSYSASEKRIYSGGYPVDPKNPVPRAGWLGLSAFIPQEHRSRVQGVAGRVGNVDKNDLSCDIFDGEIPPYAFQPSRRKLSQKIECYAPKNSSWRYIYYDDRNILQSSPAVTTLWLSAQVNSTRRIGFRAGLVGS